MRFFHFRASGDGRGVAQIVWVGDRGYDAEAIRSGLRTRGILPRLAMRRTNHGSGLALGAGSSSGHLPGSISFDASVSATTSGPTFTKRSSRSVVR